jgi:hypothetical protein
MKVVKLIRAMTDNLFFSIESQSENSVNLGHTTGYCEWQEIIQIF